MPLPWFPPAWLLNLGFLNHTKQFVFPFSFPSLLLLSGGMLGRFYRPQWALHLHQTPCVCSLSASPPPTLPCTITALTWLCVLCRHTRLLHINQSLPQDWRHQGGVLPVFRERGMGQERAQSFVLYFLPGGVRSTQAITSAAEGREEDWSSGQTGETFAWFIRDLPVEQTATERTRQREGGGER